MPPRKRQRRCAFFVRGKQCELGGAGNPPLCPGHEALYYGDDEDDYDDPVDELIDGIAERMEGVASSVGERLKKFFTDAQTRHEAEQRRRPDQQRPNGARRPPPRPQAGEDPRVVMGFSPGFPLNAATIKARKKALAAVIHPDKGGSEEAMKRLNTAADALLRSIGAQR